MSLRLDVYALDGGLCVGCGVKQRRGGSAWDWQVHHALKGQWLRRAGLRANGSSGRGVCVLLCRRCHERHENRTAPIPLEKLPERVHRSVAILGPWAVDLLARYHPPSDLSALADLTFGPMPDGARPS